MGLLTYRDFVTESDERSLLLAVNKLKSEPCVLKVYFTYDTNDGDEYPFIVEIGGELVIVVENYTSKDAMNKLSKLIENDVDYDPVIIDIATYKIRNNKPGIKVLYESEEYKSEFDRDKPIILEDWQTRGFDELLEMMRDFKENPWKLGYDPEFEDETKEANDELKGREKKSAPEKPAQVSFEELIGEVHSFCNSFGEKHNVTINVPEGWDKNPEAFIDKPQSTITDDTPTAPIMVMDAPVPVSYVNDLYGSIDQDSYENTLPYNIGPTQGVLNDTDITLEDIIACGNPRCRNKSGEYGNLS